MDASLTDLDHEKVQSFVAGTRRLWDPSGSRFVEADTVYVPYGCPDHGEPGYMRQLNACKFCALPLAVAQFREAFYEGRPVPDDELIRLFGPTLDKAFEERGRSPHTLLVFNAGSFLAMPSRVQRELVREVASRAGIKRLVIEARPTLVKDEALELIMEVAGDMRVTLRLGLEAKTKKTRLRLLGKGSTEEDIVAACESMRRYDVQSGGYALLRPAPGMDPVWARQEAVETLEWILGDPSCGGLGMTEAYMHPTCVSEGTLLHGAWTSGSFQVATLWDVLWVLQKIVGEYPGRVHLMPFSDVPPFVAVPALEQGRSLPQDLEGATEVERCFHEMFGNYRSTMDPSVLTTEGFGAKPEWWR